MPMSALPAKYGIGTMGRCAYQFVDFLKAAGQKYWQLLPIGPTSYGDSPYASFSSFAGNPYFIDLDLLAKEGLLKRAELNRPDWGDDPARVDYGKIYRSRFGILRLAFERGRECLAEEILAFREKNRGWVENYALYMAVKAHFGMMSWTEWPQEDIRLHRPGAVEKYGALLREDVDFYIFVQYLFFRQWDALRDYAHENGVQFIGDIPIYVALDSADVWSEPEFFQLDGENVPVEVSGVPPDAFTEDGQLWGNPLYDWEAMKRDGYGWWLRRIDGARRLYDIIRIDHFRGFESYYSIPAGNKTAAGGHWEKGPDRAFIDAMHKVLGEGGIIAEDLGYLTPEVKAMLAASGYPGMKIMQFAFDSREPGNYLPYTYPRNSVVYTGTHDNVTTEGWRQSASAEDVAYACRYLRCAPEDLTESMICACLSCVSDMAVIPLADWLHLDAEARINTPSTQGANWQWRLTQPLTPALSAHIAELTALYHRVPDEEL